uniref:DUF834 domain-containing protein n=1 Tax=Oryza glumipatula TaxID=40148 RepID=A0A0D9ZJV5_9ORYZ
MAVERAVAADLKMGRATEADLVVGWAATVTTMSSDDDERWPSDGDEERDCWREVRENKRNRYLRTKVVFGGEGRSRVRAREEVAARREKRRPGWRGGGLALPSIRSGGRGGGDGGATAAGPEEEFVCHEGLRPTCRNRLNHQTSAKSQMDTKGETKGRSPWAKPDDED